MKHEITVIRKEPHKLPCLVKIQNTLEALPLQEAVGGNIETVTLFEDAVVICNEEGRMMGLEPNCKIGGMLFVGTILIAGVDGEDFGDVNNHNVWESFIKPL